MTTTTKEEVIVSTQCNCMEEDGTYSVECFGCYEDSLYELNEFLLAKWQERQGDNVTDYVRVDGTHMNWTRSSGYAVVEFDNLLDALRINSDYTLYFRLEDDALTCVRTSHDEPTGASFKFSFTEEDED